ncbi:hypothetical protein HYH03_000246 [Edaphochlamys debaryana]|uniref:Protein kinase domain-containing protein n=1 Tax=Edaphochlamys debaryana TaxID=47281 RepID=A0A836C5Z6_9CHLO|nr:hypothetical protein HYH03_000246 [Edaphochlamys debaryana]|eukprot:KAG2501746.1 hypothetical protein HYH03_000246 [Edaphochlamys debaryana]
MRHEAETDAGTSVSATAAAAELTLPPSYQSEGRLASTHFSSVWLASRPKPGAERSHEHVVVKTLDASRASHAAIASNEAAALRHLAAATAHPRSTDAASRTTAPPPGLVGASAQGHPPAAPQGPPPSGAAPTPPPFVRLLDTFTADAGSSSSVPHQQGPGRQGLTATTAEPDDVSSAKINASHTSGSGRRRWRCLVLELLGPSAVDLLEAWQRPRAVPAGTKPGYRGGAGASWGPGTGAEVEGARPPAVPQGLPPVVVRGFASGALAALSILHDTARLVHLDMKPANWALRLEHPQPSPHQQRPSPPPAPPPKQPPPEPRAFTLKQLRAAEPGPSGQQARGPLVQGWSGGRGRERWALLDLGSACSLEAEAEAAAEVEAGDPAEADPKRPARVRACASLARSANVPPVGADADSSYGTPWYDTPSYAAPELTLGLAPSPASDMFSLGATVFELATGRRLFPVPQQLLQAQIAPHAEHAQHGPELPSAAEFHLALVGQLLGPPPRALLARAPRADWFYDLPRRRLLLEEDFGGLTRSSLGQLTRSLTTQGAAAAAWAGAEAEAAVEEAATRNEASRAQGRGWWRRVLWWRGRGAREEGGDREMHPAGAVGDMWELGPSSGDGAASPGGEGAVSLAWRRRGRQGALGRWQAGDMAAASGGSWDEAEVAGLVSFLRPLLQWDPRLRPSAAQAAQHPWLTGAAEGRGDGTESC